MMHRQAEQQVQRDGGAEHLGQIGGRDRQLRQHPQREDDRARIRVAARLRQVAAGGNAEPRRHRLQQDGHQVRDHDHAEQRVAVPRAAGDVGGPVARVHVADGHEVAGARERKHLAPEPGGHRHGAVHLGQAAAVRR